MSVDRYQKKKILKYIESDTYIKLKKFLKKEKINVDEIITKRGEKMLHLAAKEGSGDCLEYLLDEGANAKLVDKKGNLPLHRALEFVIENYSRANEKDLVSSLLTYSTRLLNVRNVEGFTPRELILNLEKIKTKKLKLENNFQIKESNENEQIFSEEDEWKAKLAEECDYEYETNLGKFEDDLNFVGESSETYDDWADRIYKAFTSSRKRKFQQIEHKTQKKSLQPEIDIEQAAKNYQILKEKKVKQKQMQKCDKIFNSNEVIKVDDIPFEGFEAATILDILLGDVARENAEVVKKTIREEIRRWHPDKFKQKLGERICDKNTELVMEKVKHISQALTNYGK